MHCERGNRFQANLPASRIMVGMQRRHHPVSLEQAAEEAPVLSQLMQKTQLSQCAQTIAELVPPPLRSHLAYGQIDQGEWCVLVQSNAAAAKVRQLLPLWLERLQQQGLDVQRIRLRLQGAPTPHYR